MKQSMWGPCNMLFRNTYMITFITYHVSFWKKHQIFFIPVFLNQRKKRVATVFLWPKTKRKNGKGVYPNFLYCTVGVHLDVTRCVFDKLE